MAGKEAPPSPARELDVLLTRLNAKHGAGTVMVMGEHQQVPAEVIPTGCIALDEALGIGGLPRGRVTEVYGPESSGKTTIALTVAAQAQKLGLVVAMIDAEHAVDPSWAVTIGVDWDAMVLNQPDTGEEGLEVADELAKSGLFGLLIVDSVAALVPRAEIAGEMGDSHVGLQARLMSQALRKLTGTLSQTRTAVIFINQLREKVGVMFGSPETTTGGKALKFYSSIRLDTRRIETLKDGTEAVGNRTRVKVAKNKLSPPFKTAEFDIMFNEGISAAGELLDLGAARGVVKKAGAWYTYEGQQLGQGKEKARIALLEQPELAAEIGEKVRAARPAGPPRRIRPSLAAAPGPAPWEEKA